MGYAEAAGLPAIYRIVRNDRTYGGLCFCGTESHSGLGARFDIAALIAAAIIPLSSGDAVSSGDAGRRGLAGMLAILAEYSASSGVSRSLEW